MKLDDFRNPPKEFRPLSFWSWNDKLEAVELKRQIRKMDQGGWGGFFMHARGGLETDYLSEEWMARVQDSVTEAERLGLQAWLYDEDGWPSGSAGSAIPRLDRDFRETHLFIAFDHIPHHSDDVEILKIYSAKKTYGRRAKAYRIDGLDFSLGDFQVVDQVIPETDRTTVFLYRWVAPLCNPRYKGACYVDLMNAEATAAFLSSTHEKYRQACGSHFGTTVPGIFTDDLTLIWNIWNTKNNALPWTHDLPRRFLAEYGYELGDHLLQLYFTLDGYEKVRLDFFRLVGHLFATNYTKQIYDWCERYGLKSTGHLMGDQRGFIDVMQHFEWMHYPATDNLAFSCDNLIINRQMQSVVSQLGKERAVCESFAAAGHELDFEGFKWISDWLLINGVNAFVMHLSQYSMRGLRKRDHPPAISWQQPWWDANAVLADYQTRLCFSLSQGNRLCDVLILSPVESREVAFNTQDLSGVNRISEVFEGIARDLLTNHHDFEIGSEDLLARYGSVDQDRLKIGLANYRLVILPSLLTIRATTLTLLEHFLQAGGSVLSVGEPPRLIDGKAEPGEISRRLLTKAIAVAPFHLVKEMAWRSPRFVSIRTLNGQVAHTVLYHLRQLPGTKLCFLANNDRHSGHVVQIRLMGHWHITLLDALDGTERSLVCQYEQGCTVFQHSFARTESILLRLTETTDTTQGTTPEAVPPPDREIRLNGKWQLKIEEDNSLVLDTCVLSLDAGQTFSEPRYHLKANAEIQQVKRDFRLRFFFDVETRITTEVSLAVEQPEGLAIRLNGNLVRSQAVGWFKDPAFQLIPLGNDFPQGRNVIELAATWKEGCSVESIFLCGRFRVNSQDFRHFRLAPLDQSSFLSNLSEEGFPFYAGNAELSHELMVERLADRKVILELGSLEAAAARVTVNGQEVGWLPWPPYRMDLSGFLQEGENHITLGLYNTLRNLLGPHHLVRVPEARWVSPASFEEYGNWSESFDLVPFGFQGARILIYEKEIR